MAAKQAATLYKGSHVEVIGSTTIPQCYSALTMLDFSSDDLTIIVGNFKEAIDRVSSGEITTSIRNTTVNKVEIKKGDYIGILDGKLLVSNKDKLRTLKSLISKVKDINPEFNEKCFLAGNGDIGFVPQSMFNVVMYGRNE